METYGKQMILCVIKMPNTIMVMLRIKRIKLYASCHGFIKTHEKLEMNVKIMGIRS